jgi:hypothetical protein
MRQVQYGILAFACGILAGLLMCLPRYAPITVLGGFLAAFLLQNLRMANLRLELLTARTTLKSVTRMSQNAVAKIDALEAELAAKRGKVDHV